MRHKQKYYDVLGFTLIIIGVVIIGCGLLYGYGVFHGGQIPPILEGTQSGAQSISVSNVHTGDTTVGLPSGITQNLWRVGDAIIQYLFVLLLFYGGGKLAKLGLAVSKTQTPLKPEKEEKER